VVDAAGEIYGDIANMAARVQALAEPGAVLITARLQRQVAGLFVAEERGTHTRSSTSPGCEREVAIKRGDGSSPASQRTFYSEKSHGPNVISDCVSA